MKAGRGREALVDDGHGSVVAEDARTRNRHSVLRATRGHLRRWADAWVAGDEVGLGRGGDVHWDGDVQGDVQGNGDVKEEAVVLCPFPS